MASLDEMRRKFPGERVYHVLRWLKANKFSVPKATEQLSEHLAWQASALPIEPASVGPMMDKNIMSRIGQAVDGSAVLLITARNFPPPSPESIALVTQTALFQVLASLQALGGMGSPAAKLSVVYDRSGGVSTSQELVGLPSLVPVRFLFAPSNRMVLRFCRTTHGLSSLCSRHTSPRRSPRPFSTRLAAHSVSVGALRR